MQDALAHPYLAELHSRAREPVCPAAFDFSFENGYPQEMPQVLLQRHMFAEMQLLRARMAGLVAGSAAPVAPASTPTTSGPVGAGADPCPAADMQTAQ